jgi:nicotinamidase-related amidase
VKTAVVVIDVQEGLCNGEKAAYASHDVIVRINAVTAQARAAGAVVIFVQHETEAGLLEFETDPWQLARGLEVEPDDLSLRKTTPDAFHRTALAAVLQTHGATELVICGMHTEFCVDTTTRRALALGYPVVLVADAHTTTDKAHLSAARIIVHHNETLARISSFGPRARVVASAALQL